MRTRVVFALAAAGAMLAACGGGTSSPVPTPASTPSRNTSAKATFVVKIPPKLSTSARTPKYLTADVQGIEFSVSQNNGSVYAGSVFYPISAGASYCTTPSGGGLTCTLAVVAVPGDDTFVVTTYDKPELYDANVISTGSVEKTISAQTSNTVNIVTSGIPTFFAMSLDVPYPTAGVGESQNIHTLVLDADANVIVGPYDLPITFSSSDTSGATQLSATSAASSTDAAAIALTYSGAAMTQPVTITVQSNSPYAMSWNSSQPANLHYFPGGSGVVAYPSYLLFANTAASPQSITLEGTDTSIVQPFVASTGLDYFSDWGVLDNLNEAWQYANGCQGIATVSGTSPTFTVTPVHTGVCYLNVSDSAGHYGAVPVVVQSM